MIRLTDGDFDALLKRAAEKCMEDDVALYRSVGTDGSVGKLLSCPEKTKRRNIMKSLRKTVKVASLVLVCTLAVTAAVTMSVKAIREKVTSAVVSWFRNYGTVEYEDTDVDITNAEKVKIMNPTCVPERYSIIERAVYEHAFWCKYVDKDGDELCFEQSTYPLVRSFDTNDGCKESKITLSGEREAVLFTYDSGRYILICYDGENYFYIDAAGLSYDELMSFVEGLKEKEEKPNKMEYVPEKEKTLVLASGKTVKLTYSSQIEDAAGNILPEYTDEFGGIYTYRDNELLSVAFLPRYWRVRSANDPDYVNKGNLDEDEIISSVESAVRDLFGERFYGFELLSCENRGGREYTLEFGRPFGKEKVLMSGQVYVTASVNGEIQTCIFNMCKAYKHLDESVLDGVTKESLEEYFREKALKKHPDLTEIEVQSIYPVENNGKPAIGIYGECYYPTDFDKLREDEAEMMRRSMQTTSSEILTITYELD